MMRVADATVIGPGPGAGVRQRGIVRRGAAHLPASGRPDAEADPA
jgi:hypothetical protein